MSDDQVAVPPPSLVVELRKLAEAATPGPWHHSAFHEWLTDSGHARFLIAASGTGKAGLEQHAANVEYIAAVSPDVVLALLTRQEALERALRTTLDHTDCHCTSCDLDAPALLDASQQPVKPPVLPEPDLRLMGEAVKGGKYPEQPVKP